MKRQLLLIVVGLWFLEAPSQAQRYSVPNPYSGKTSKARPESSPSFDANKQLSYVIARLKRFEFLRESGRKVPEGEVKKLRQHLEVLEQQLDASRKSQGLSMYPYRRPGVELLSQKPYALLLAPRLR